MCFIYQYHEDFHILAYMLCLISHLARQIQKADTFYMENKDQCACYCSLHATANGKMVELVLESLANTYVVEVNFSKVVLFLYRILQN